MRSSPRFWASISSLAILSSLTLGLPGKPAFAADNQAVFIFGGDVEWSLNARPPTVRYRVADPTAYGKIVYGRRDVRDQVTGDWPPIPYIDQGESAAYLKSLGLKGPSDASSAESLSYPLLDHEEYTQDYSNDDALLNRPLQRLAPVFHAADFVMVNCEGALSDHGRQVGLNRTPERFALSMRRLIWSTSPTIIPSMRKSAAFSTPCALFHWPGLPTSAAEWILPMHASP
jgi:hypothetical protein